MSKVITTLRSPTTPPGLEKIAQLGQSLHKRRADVLAYFDIGASNGPVEAINGCLEHLRGIALGFKNLGHYILVVPASLRRTASAVQRTLNPEEPDYRPDLPVPASSPRH